MRRALIATPLLTPLIMLMPVAPAMAGPLTTLRDLLTAPSIGYSQRGLVAADATFSALMACAIVVRLCRLGWSGGGGDIHGWQDELGDLLMNVMLPGYGTLFACHILVPAVPAMITYVSETVTGIPGVANPDAIWLLGLTTAVSLVQAALHPLSSAPLTIGGFSFAIPNFGIDTLWMTIINFGIALIAGFIVLLALTKVAVELVATYAGGIFSIAYNTLSIAFSAAGVTKPVTERYLGGCWQVIMNIVGMIAYAAAVVTVFADVPFHAGLLNTNTFLFTVFSVLGLSYAAMEGAKKVSHIGETLYAGGSFVTTGETLRGATAPGRTAMQLVGAAQRMMRRA